MKYPPAPTSPLSEELGSIGFVAAASRAQDFAASQAPDPEIIYATLRHAIADDSFEAQTVFNTIAESAKLLTGAAAAALAIRRNGLVVCRARVGEVAPPLGARLSVDSGLSGECLRTSTILRCDDTQKDIRVDPEVCRELGLRSIAAVPLRGPRGTMGVLETFSDRPFAFSAEQIDALMRLAELAETARVRESGVTSSAVRPAPIAAPIPKVAVDPLVAKAAPGKEARLHVPIPFPNLKRWYLAGGASVGVMVLFLLSAWMWRSPENASAARAVPAPTERPSPVATPQPVASGVLVWTPPPVGSKSAVKPASKVDVEDVVSHRPAPAAKDTPSQPDAQKLEPTDAAANTEIPPQMASLAPDKSLSGMVAPSVSIPQFSTPVSQGVVEGVLQRKVQPVYPTDALPFRLSGPVVLDATIGKDGRIQNLKIVSGHPILARAAVGAVREWRYTPSTLNGTPVVVQKEITVSFKAP
jgi:protein TonB